MYNSPLAVCLCPLLCSSFSLLASGAADDSVCIFGPATASDPSSASSATAAASSSGLALLHSEKNAHRGDVNCVSWNPQQGHLLCTVGDDAVIKIWKFTQ